ncbi:M3 family oligoendopeptidase [Priestia taiwanensis]|uniref:Oligoendopeptidase F n=1 Tax=Priestia taiwanensis TaxID=1347902 RepID=A0A917AZ12_9BACI|nr:M3 family oligoendopeptidase [Priestia taiwanensis]MBM7365031.1 M3 family oligoendopeptidase [Priestia taiwanensis]GGE83527.1 oligoendopeptidase F [Priestia taiwanensis]
MSFLQYEYVRPNKETIEQKFKSGIEKFNTASTFEEQEGAMHEINNLRNEVSSMLQIAYVRHTIDTTDTFYKEEKDFLDGFSPILQSFTMKYYRALVASTFRNELEAKYGEQIFNLAECQLKTFNDDIIEDLQQENRLVSHYTSLIASAKIPFNGEEYTLAQLKPFLEVDGRDVRKEALQAHTNFFVDNKQELDETYDKLVKLRTSIAKKLGFDSFVELGYARMRRTDYNRDMVANFRKQVETFIVPITMKLKERQRERIGVDTLYYYDSDYNFPNGNATPKGDPEWIVQNAAEMYKELSPETDEFFRSMIDNDLMDLVAKKGKASGGYCTYFSAYKVPFIFSNFNGTSGDIDVLTHEAGHAFQKFCSRHFVIPEYAGPTSESAEIHSMSMEFFTYPWMDKFFQEETDKYYFEHLSSGLLFLPYGVAVDEFQHRMYDEPNLTPDERHAVWREIEKKYLPHRQYDNNEYLENGGFWQRQLHIYKYPFYYIDYTLAQICALQFWKKMQENQEEAWNDYLKLCSEGGSKSFLKLVSGANLLSPFDDGTVESVVGVIEDYLNTVDDKKLGTENITTN